MRNNTENKVVNQQVYGDSDELSLYIKKIRKLIIVFLISKYISNLINLSLFLKHKKWV